MTTNHVLVLEAEAYWKIKGLLYCRLIWVIFEEIQVGYLILSKNDLAKKLCAFAVRKNFQYCVDRMNKKLYVLTYVNLSYLWKLRAIKMRDSDMCLKFLSMLILTHAKTSYENKIISKLSIGL